MYSKWVNNLCCVKSAIIVYKQTEGPFYMWEILGDEVIKIVQEKT